MKPKLIVTGYARHGKDTVCEMLTEYGYNFKSSSEFVGKKVVYPVLKDKYNYQSWEECYKDRVNHRSEWFDLIAEYNAEDKGRLGRELFEEYDIYCGIRNEEELMALLPEELLLIWVDAQRRLQTVEDSSSMTIDRDKMPFIIDNNGTLEDLKYRVELLAQIIDANRGDRFIFDQVRPKTETIKFGDRGDRDGY